MHVIQQVPDTVESGLLSSLSIQENESLTCMCVASLLSKLCRPIRAATIVSPPLMRLTLPH